MNYEFRKIETDDASLKAIANLLRLVFPKAKQFTDKYIAWQYRDNPDGKVVGYNAYLDNTLVAHYAMLPIKAKLFGKEEKGLLSLNTATRPDHQGKKLFTQLAEMSYNTAAEDNFGFVIGVANANSTPGFVNKLGFQLLGMLDAKLGKGKIKSNEMAFDLERTWNEMNLKWRLSNPEQQYKIKNGNIYAATDKPWIEAMLLKTKLPDNAVSIGARPLKLWIGVDRSINWSGSFYFDVPVSMRPSPLNLIFKDLSGTNRRLDPKKVRFNAIDFDAY